MEWSWRGRAGERADGWRREGERFCTQQAHQRAAAGRVRDDDDKNW